MALRFQRRIRIAPGVRINIGKTGLSLSAGAPGASLTLGKKGLYSNLGLSGTGLSDRRRLDKKSSLSSASNQNVTVGLKWQISDEGELRLSWPDGRALTERELKNVRQNSGEQIRQLMESVCEDRNNMLAELSHLHFKIKKPSREPTYDPALYPYRSPQESLTILHKFKMIIWPPFKKKIISAINQWESDRKNWDFSEIARAKREVVDIWTSIQAMEDTLSDYLSEVLWPIDPEINFDVGENNKTIAIDVLLPTEDEIPDKEWSVPARQYRLLSKPISAARRRQIYRDYVHSIALRVLGEIFAHLPTVERVLFSANRISINPASGHDEVEYVFSAIVSRQDWEGINFERIRQVDPVATIAAFTLRRNMTKTGLFKSVEPFGLADLENSVY